MTPLNYYLILGAFLFCVSVADFSFLFFDCRSPLDSRLVLSFNPDERIE